MKTLVKTSMVKEYLQLLDREEITVSRFAELLNEAANRALVESGEAEKLNIIFEEYGHHCGDGCCYNYGTITTVNGVELETHNQDGETIVRQVLEHLGYKVEVEYREDFR
jgi:hypothetical protein